MSLFAPLRRDADMEVALVYYAAGEENAPHRHREAQLTMLLAGDYLEDSDHGQRRVHGPALGTKPAGFEHANRFGSSGALILSVCLGERWDVPDYETRCDAGAFGVRALTRLDGAAPGLIGAVRAEIAGDGTACAPPPEWLDAARGRLGARAEAPAVRDVAADMGMHPVAFARRFRRHFGTSPVAYRQARRVSRAIEALLLRRDPPAEIAAACGFADQAHLGHAVRRATGFTPLQLRRLLGKGV